MPSPPGESLQRWRCITGCGACCRLDPALRGEDLEHLDAHQRSLYLSMVGPDGWCIHFDTGGRRCRIYATRPDFCKVENLMTLFAEGDREPVPSPARETGMDGAAQDLAIASCRTQIRAEYGGRGRVMKRFERAIRPPS
ncbi:MAG: YkgJ family cysteine cluster protein [Cyanobium sp.]